MALGCFYSGILAQPAAAKHKSHWPPAVDPDTVTQFIFLDRMIPVKDCPGVTVTSNYSFKTKMYEVTWTSISTRDSVVKFSINHSASFNEYYNKDYQPVDTLMCHLFDRTFTAFKLQRTDTKNIFIYEKHEKASMVFNVRIKKKNTPRQALDFIERLFNR